MSTEIKPTAKTKKYQIVIVLNGSYDPENPLTHMGPAGVSFENKEDAQDWVVRYEALLREKNVMEAFNSDTHYEIVGGEEEFKTPSVESESESESDYDDEEDEKYFGKKS